MEFLRILEGLRSPVLDVVFQGITYLGQDIGVLAVICILFWGVHKRLAYQVALSFFGAGLLLQNIKITARIERPWVLDPAFVPVQSAVKAATGYSFPSGHTQSAASLYTVLGMKTRKRWLRPALLLLPFLVAFSRMYLGVHTPKDVAAGLALGIGCSLLSGPALNWLEGPESGPKRDALGAAALALVSCAALVYAGAAAGRESLSPDRVMDAFKAAGAGLGLAFGWYLERRLIRFSTEGTGRSLWKRVGAGLLLTLGLKLLLKALLGSGIFGEILQYALLVLWVTAGYPALFTWLERRAGGNGGS